MRIFSWCLFFVLSVVVYSCHTKSDKVENTKGSVFVKDSAVVEDVEPDDKGVLSPPVEVKDSILLDLKSFKFRVVVAKTADGYYKYKCWNWPNFNLTEPDLLIEQGDTCKVNQVLQYTFTNGEYEYSISDGNDEFLLNVRRNNNSIMERKLFLSSVMDTLMMPIPGKKFLERNSTHSSRVIINYITTYFPNRTKQRVLDSTNWETGGAYQSCKTETDYGLATVGLNSCEQTDQYYFIFRGYSKVEVLRMLKLLYSDPEGVYWKGDLYSDDIYEEGIGCEMKVSDEEEGVKIGYYCGC